MNMGRKKLSIAERQERLNRRIKILTEYILPIVASAITATLLSIVVLR